MAGQTQHYTYSLRGVYDGATRRIHVLNNREVVGESLWPGKITDRTQAAATLREWRDLARRMKAYYWISIERFPAEQRPITGGHPMKRRAHTFTQADPCPSCGSNRYHPIKGSKLYECSNYAALLGQTHFGTDYRAPAPTVAPGVYQAAMLLEVTE